MVRPTKRKCELTSCLEVNTPGECFTLWKTQSEGSALEISRLMSSVPSAGKQVQVSQTIPSQLAPPGLIFTLSPKDARPLLLGSGQEDLVEL